MRKLCIFFLAGICSIFITVSAQISTDDIDWQAFLSRHDLVWDTITSDYYAGAILGNGMLGTNVYAAEGANTMRWDIGRSDVAESRKGTDILYDKARLPIGWFSVSTAGNIVSSHMRLNLYDAEAKGSLKTDKGEIAFTTRVDANNDVIVIETVSRGAESAPVFVWNAEEAVSPRSLFSHSHSDMPQSYIDNPNPAPYRKTDGYHTFHIQQLFSGMVYVAAWKETDRADGRTLLVTVSFERSVDEAINKARATLRGYDIAESATRHKQWWHEYYPASFVSFPDARMESFYWIQQYKLACVTRADKNIIDLTGPWLRPSPWPAIWWNLNIQLTYSPLFAANRLELSEPLWRAMNENIQALIDNVPRPEWRHDAAAIGRSSSYDLVSPLSPDLALENRYETGNLPWALFYYWQYCVFKADREELLERFYPLLKRSMAYYSHIAYKGDDGLYHLPMTASPEYKPAEDCNYDLALMRWGLKTLLDIDREYSLDDPMRKRWEDLSENLTPYPANSRQGYMIGRKVRLKSSHRHYSHLLMIYPLREITWENPANRELISRSLHHWISMKGALQGYSYSGSSSIYSLMGDGDRAAQQLHTLLSEYIRPNTLYRESGPVIETPLSAAASLQELYIQYRNGHTAIFPAVPGAWEDASFIDFRTAGGFLISALRRGGKTRLVQIKATADGKCTLQTDLDLSSGIPVEARIIDRQQGLIELTMKKGDTVILSEPGFAPQAPYFSILLRSEMNSFGLNNLTGS